MKNKLILASAFTIPVVVASVPVQAEDPNRDEIKVFKDISTSYVYHDIIGEMGGLGIINGYEDGTFKPNDKINRRHAAALISRAKDDNLPVNDKLVQFKDISKTDRGYDEIRRLQQAGMFVADKNGNFNPNKELTRAEMARILVVAFDLKVKANYDFSDVPAGHAYSEDVRALYSNGITTGDNGLFLPNEGLSRAHYAVFMYRAMNLDKNYVPQPIPKPVPEVKPPIFEVGHPRPPASLVNALSTWRASNTDLFDDDAPFLMTSFYYNPISAKIYLKGADALRKTDMKYSRGLDNYASNYSAAVMLSSDGYEHPTMGGNTELIFQGIGGDRWKIVYDFRSDQAHALAKEWIILMDPEFSVLLPQIEQKVKDARVGEANKDFRGNINIVEVGDYEIQFGVDSFYEWMWIDVRSKK